MPDRFSQDAYGTPSSVTEMWDMLSAAFKAIEKEDSRSADEYPSAPEWTVLTDGRQWKRATAQQARATTEDAEVTSYAVDLSFYGSNLQWSVTGRVFKNGGLAFQLSCYAGQDRLRTEEVFRDVIRRMARRGIALEVQPSTVMSSDDGSANQAALPLKPRNKPRSVLGVVGGSIKKHVGSYIVGVLLLITGGVLAALGFKVI